MNLCLLDADSPRFPNPNTAAEEPDGLLAVGGNLSPSTLMSAYRQGIFPWYQDDDPILWWSPASRCVLIPKQLHISRSLRRCLRQGQFRVSTDEAFAQVVEACAAPRTDDAGTWIIDEMIEAYCQLHQLGCAHSVEVWAGGKLAGGIYGVAVGSVFCGESMFSGRTNGSKVAMAYLCQWLDDQKFNLLDCQINNPHLEQMGAQSMPREQYLNWLVAHRDSGLQWPEARPVSW
jgi:leucyl/phenylalanyl-tRNA--protein transferase